MFFRLLLFFAVLKASILANDGGKFMVVDNGTYKKIQISKILDGGIKKEYVLSSTRLSEDDLQNNYPEYFLYDGERCTIINEVVDVKSNNTTTKVVKLLEDMKIDEEIKKIRLLQILVDSKNKKYYEDLNKDILKATGMICDYSVVFREERYFVNQSIGDLIIEQISLLNSTVYIRKR